MKDWKRINNCRLGKGDYTKERHQWLGEQSLTEVWKQMEELSNFDKKKYEEVIK